VIDLPVDTKSDAMVCAAAIATWLSLGHDEAETKIVMDAGTWRVAFRDL
jgi:hypothetical protein